MFNNNIDTRHELLNSKKFTELLFNPFILNQNDGTYSTCDFNPTSCTYKTIDELNQIPNINNDFSIMHVNVRSIRKNFNALINLISSMNVKPMAIAITESWLYSGEEVSFNLPGYVFFSLPRPSGAGEVLQLS